MRGSQEAFTELLRNNVSLLRRQFRSGTPVAEIATAHTRAKTEYCRAMTAPWPRLKPSMLFGTVWKKSNCPCFWTVLTLPLF